MASNIQEQASYVLGGAIEPVDDFSPAHSAHRKAAAVQELTSSMRGVLQHSNRGEGERWNVIISDLFIRLISVFGFAVKDGLKPIRKQLTNLSLRVKNNVFVRVYLVVVDIRIVN